MSFDTVVGPQGLDDSDTGSSIDEGPTTCVRPMVGMSLSLSVGHFTRHVVMSGGQGSGVRRDS